MIKDKKEAVVIAIKTKDGQDILGFYIGDSGEETEERSMILYRPILINPTTYLVHGSQVHTYATSLYFQFGSGVSYIPYDNIVIKDVASEFFSSFYVRAVGELIAKSSMINDSYSKFYEKQDLSDIMENTDSMYFEQTSEFNH